MITIYESDVIDELTVCPYCMTPRTYESLGCCGESREHFEQAVATKDEVYLLSEVFIVPQLPPGDNPAVPLTVPLDDVKKALRIAESHDEDYSRAILGFLVAKHTKYAPLVMLALTLFSCAPGLPIVQFGQPVPGPRGEVGAPGQDGKTCSVSQLENGALLSCPDGSSIAILNGAPGADGQPAPASAFTIVGTVDPCGPQGRFDEVLLKLANGQVLAHFASGNKQFLTIVPPGNYTVTDGTGCKFTITNEGEVTGEHN